MYFAQPAAQPEPPSRGAVRARLAFGWPDPFAVSCAHAGLAFRASFLCAQGGFGAVEGLRQAIRWYRRAEEPTFRALLPLQYTTEAIRDRRDSSVELIQ